MHCQVSPPLSPLGLNDSGSAGRAAPRAVCWALQMQNLQKPAGAGSAAPRPGWPRQKYIVCLKENIPTKEDPKGPRDPEPLLRSARCSVLALGRGARGAGPGRADVMMMDAATPRSDGAARPALANELAAPRGDCEGQRGVEAREGELRGANSRRSRKARRESAERLPEKLTMKAVV